MKIFYVCPDIRFPSGGIKRLYTHVKILREQGYDAFILHLKKGFKPTWFTHNLPIYYFNDNPPVSPKDTLVIPEGFFSIIKKMKSVRKVAIALNPYYIFLQMPVGENWNHYGIDWVMTPSKITKDLIEYSMKIPNIRIIGTAIDQDLFYCVPDNKILQVAYIKRKDTLTNVIEKIIKSNGRFKDIKFIPIENMHIDEYAKILQQSQVYLTTQQFEGINRSILEAMACGCICTGSDGLGGKEYIIESGEKQNFILSENTNFLDLSIHLADILDKIQEMDPWIEMVRKNALSTASQFTFENEKKSVLEFWREYLEENK